MAKPGNNPKKLITRCPFCGDQLGITRLSCHGCNTQIDSQLEIPLFFRLPPDLQELVIDFAAHLLVQANKALGLEEARHAAASSAFPCGSGFVRQAHGHQ